MGEGAQELLLPTQVQYPNHSEWQGKPVEHPPGRQVTRLVSDQNLSQMTVPLASCRPAHRPGETQAWPAWRAVHMEQGYWDEIDMICIEFGGLNSPPQKVNSWQCMLFCLVVQNLCSLSHLHKALC